MKPKLGPPKPPANPKPLGTTLSKRWTESQLERAAKISNDIAEDIDCKESRKVLREAVAIYADLHCDASTELIYLKKTLECERLIKRIEREIEKTSARITR